MQSLIADFDEFFFCYLLVFIFVKETGNQDLFVLNFEILLKNLYFLRSLSLIRSATLTQLEYSVSGNNNLAPLHLWPMETTLKHKKFSDIL